MIYWFYFEVACANENICLGSILCLVIWGYFQYAIKNAINEHFFPIFIPFQKWNFKSFLDHSAVGLKLYGLKKFVFEIIKCLSFHALFSHYFLSGYEFYHTLQNKIKWRKFSKICRFIFLFFKVVFHHKIKRWRETLSIKI